MQENWLNRDSKSPFYPLANIVNKNQRIKYARYKLTGVVDDSEKYSVGNPTISLVPIEMKNKFFHIEDDFFETLTV